MASTRRVVVGLDGSAGSLAALDYTLARPEQFGDVHAVMSWRYPWLALVPPPFGGVAVAPLEGMQEATEAALDAVLTEHLGDRRSDVTAHVAEGDSAEVVIRTADAVDAATIAVGTRGLGGFKGLMLGSVSSRVAERSPVPVVVVPVDHAADRPESERIVVGVDGSAGADRALRWALDRARATDHIVAVSSWELRVFTGFEGMAIDPVDLSDATESMLQSAIARVRRAEDPAVEARVVEGDPRIVLLEESKNAHLLVVGARGGGLVAHVLLGSVAHWLVHRPTVPVAVIPAAQST